MIQVKIYVTLCETYVAEDEDQAEKLAESLLNTLNRSYTVVDSSTHTVDLNGPDCPHRAD